MTNTSWTLSTRIDGAADKPVLLLGHSLGSSPAMWDEVVPHLVGDLRVVRYCLPGHGGAPVAPVDGPLTMSDVLGALARTLETLGIARAHLAGLSFGGLTALAAGIARPDWLSSIAVMSSGPATLPLDQWPAKAERVREEGTESLLDATFERWFTPDARAQHPRVWRAIRDDFAACADEGYAQCCEVLGATDLDERVGEITCPTLIISAENDGGLPFEAAESLAGRLGTPQSQRTLLKLPGLRHMSAVEAPEQVAHALLAHVTRADCRRSHEE
ncbi:MAG: alpha/beta fold hydrolase [Actinomycetaceae bacterium]|nr:alpha/beta fold hydrolase [Actinomycetaceae bacterium]